MQQGDDGFKKALKTNFFSVEALFSLNFDFNLLTFCCKEH